MSSEELTLWIAYRDSFGFKQDRQEFMLACGFADIVNCWVKRPVKAKDYIPTLKREKIILPFAKGIGLLDAYLKAVKGKRRAKYSNSITQDNC